MIKVCGTKARWKIVTEAVKIMVGLENRPCVAFNGVIGASDHTCQVILHIVNAFDNVQVVSFKTNFNP